MKRSSGPRKTANLSCSVNQQLNMYALAAGAAGVSLLASIQPSEAKIVYTKVNIQIKYNTRLDLDLNHDGIGDFTIFNRFNRTFGQRLYVRGGINGIEQSNGYAAELDSGARIGRSQNFAPFGLMFSTGPGGEKGNWVCEFNEVCPFGGYLGLKFKLRGKIHYGWARLGGAHGVDDFRLFGYAYETIPGKSIIAGQTKGMVDDPTNEGVGTGASVTKPIPDAPQPPSLGMLALGAQGVPLWRRKESVGASENNSVCTFQ
jgi:hypothetical protein